MGFRFYLFYFIVRLHIVVVIIPPCFVSVFISTYLFVFVVVIIVVILAPCSVRVAGKLAECNAINFIGQLPRFCPVKDAFRI
jgi:hypothetical protein